MKHTTHLARSATAAIAAALVFGSTPLFAQDAGPAASTTVPEPAPPIVAPPVTVVPTIAPAPAAAPPTVVSQPVVQQVHYPPAAAPAAGSSAAPAPAPKATFARSAAAAKTVTRTITTQTTARAAPAPVSSPAASDVAPPSAAADVLPPAPVVADQAPPVEQAQPAATTGSSPLLNLIVLGGLLVLVLAILAVIYRRFAGRDRNARPDAVPAPTRANAAPRPAARPAAQPTPVRASVAPAALPIATAPEPIAAAVSPEVAAVTAPVRADRPAEPVHTEPTPIRRPNVSVASAARTPGTLPSAGASVDLPARVPEDYEERSALLKRMIEARPDKANPFTNRKSRAKRARLILQSLGRKFEDADPWIDLSQYPNNWPELARRYSQAA